MTVNDLINILKKVEDKDRQIVISNILMYPFAVTPIRAVVEDVKGPIYIQASRNDR